MKRNPERLRLARVMVRQSVDYLRRSHYGDGRPTDCGECIKLAELKAELEVMDRRAREATHKEVQDDQPPAAQPGDGKKHEALEGTER